ncbi:hypothetical protein EVAR_67347_1 [Eumeta japonica]|uniref:Uncharacterized protein n=1 Tax=Eumeta variegata TaxID=151549 RepID=A0A4C1SUE1_EUMVA|nr:hypothetical protein EVAR_67347_1 [Eumeta japonica]
MWNVALTVSLGTYDDVQDFKSSTKTKGNTTLGLQIFLFCCLLAVTYLEVLLVGVSRLVEIQLETFLKNNLVQELPIVPLEFDSAAMLLAGLMMEPEGKHRNSIMKQRILAVFGLVEIVLRCTLTMNDFQGLMMQLEGSDNGAGSLEAPSSDPESQSWSNPFRAIPTSPNMTLKITHGGGTSQENSNKLKYD